MYVKQKVQIVNLVQNWTIFHIKEILMEIDLQHHFTSTIFNEYSHLAKLGFTESTERIKEPKYCCTI